MEFTGQELWTALSAEAPGCFLHRTLKPFAEKTHLWMDPNKDYLSGFTAASYEFSDSDILTIEYTEPTLPGETIFTIDIFAFRGGVFTDVHLENLYKIDPILLSEIFSKYNQNVCALRRIPITSYSFMSRLIGELVADKYALNSEIPDTLKSMPYYDNYDPRRVQLISPNNNLGVNVWMGIRSCVPKSVAELYA